MTGFTAERNSTGVHNVIIFGHYINPSTPLNYKDQDRTQLYNFTCTQSGTGSNHTSCSWRNSGETITNTVVYTSVDYLNDLGAQLVYQ